MLVISVKQTQEGYLLVGKSDKGTYHKRYVTYGCAHAFINKRGCWGATVKKDCRWYHLLITKHWHIENVLGVKTNEEQSKCTNTRVCG